jgi:hypothetical protein
LTNKANIWLSEDEWNLEEANDKRYYIENLSRDKVLGKGIYIRFAFILISLNKVIFCTYSGLQL